MTGEIGGNSFIFLKNIFFYENSAVYQCNAMNNLPD
ncbi:hypothetical protein EHW99_0268 [Erwinia amylovora]|uniref:Uncharacterized protein n=2 Tax=Erwinia amylovora TaxID=552 RepID=A0A831ESL9_ERWAM|nr:TetR family transcriptional regulator [Erwinia amylovora]EKV52789.1 hypothetical protein EaACW_3379 [Erwinia amylovora ACW56400]CBA23503.1 hypothetical protein predicted by Glimmer/Critica [Erwinia amylovora CFBP1430]CCO80216.1 hypothetical protein BN432_3447 [Erwinia amylovora Ea356]CCO84023.1 hypothetical protein BN433_3476 [Erwinia amylovora Ea266]CCO87782.1 hypothetical protein BN434_3423 [Erwinia amylovora CFBP 2585]CCO91572.1 hypothetical protein BN435_3430 [Erwinia amylovora 01SFR-B